MNRFTKFGIVAALATPMLISTAYATVIATPPSVGLLEMMISSGSASNTMLIQGTSSSILSEVLGYGQTGSLANVNGWSINASVTSSAPVINGVFGLDLSSATVTCSGRGWGCSTDPLTIAVSATGFTTPMGPNGFLADISGNAVGGMATSTAYFDPNNNYFCAPTGTSGISCGSNNLIGSGTLIGSTGGSFLGGPVTGTIRSYSLTVVDTFSASNAGDPSYSLDTTLVQAPEPGALAMFAAGLLGCALFINRRRRASRQS
jgi:hypothetical protein